MEPIHTKFKNGYSASIDYGINFYNENLLFFNNVTQFKSQQELLMFIEVYFQCVASFVTNKQFKKAIAALKLVPVIESAIDGFKIDRAKFVLYKWLINQKAICLYYIRDYKQAKKLFDELQDYEPENDAFKNWIEYCELGQIKRFVNILMCIWAVIIISIEFLKHTQKHTQYIALKMTCLTVEAILTVTIIALMLYVQFKSNRKLSR